MINIITVLFCICTICLGILTYYVVKYVESNSIFNLPSVEYAEPSVEYVEALHTYAKAPNQNHYIESIIDSKGDDGVEFLTDEDEYHLYKGR